MINRPFLCFLGRFEYTDLGICHHTSIPVTVQTFIIVIRLPKGSYCKNTLLLIWKILSENSHIFKTLVLSSCATGFSEEAFIEKL